MAASVDPNRFRRVLGTVVAPVSIVTSLDGETPHGTTVSAFCSLSLRPPMVLVALDRDSGLLGMIERTGRYGVNVLAHGQRRLAERFAHPEGDRFADVDWRSDGGLPRLEGAHAWLACELSELLPGGDHRIATGMVVAAEHADSEPLVHRGRAFWTVSDAGDQRLTGSG